MIDLEKQLEIENVIRNDKRFIVMKKVFLTIVLLFFALIMFSQENTTLVKTSTPEIYESIKTFAQAKYGNDYSMVSYEVDKQCDAVIKFVEYFYKYKDTDVEKTRIILAAMDKWTDEDGFVDYTMVVYEMEKQFKAYDKLK